MLFNRLDFKIDVMRSLYMWLLYGGSLFLGACQKDTTTPVPPHFKEGLEAGINLGLAAGYANDQGIQQNPYVLAAENFESGVVTIKTEEDRYKQHVKVISGQGYNSSYAAEHSWVEGYNGPTCRYPIPESAHEGERNAYFVRMYFKFDKSFHPYYGVQPPTETYAGVGVKGFGIYNEQGPSGTNIPCDGTNWYGASCQFVGWGPSAKEVANDKFLWFGHLYSYNPGADEAQATLGEIKVTNPPVGSKPYRFSIYSDPYQYIHFDEWNCYEVGLYLNTPGKSDGEARFWINGILQSRATHMRFRDIEDLKPLTVHLNLHRTTEDFPQTMKRYADNIVIATRYIGPVVSSVQAGDALYNCGQMR